MRLLKETFWNTTAAKIQSGLILAAIAIMCFIPGFSDSFTPLYFAFIFNYCILSLSWSFFSGKTGYVSLATAAFYGVGVYIMAVFGRLFPLWIIILLAAASTFTLGFLIGIVSLRLRGVYFTIFTFGLSLFLNKFFHWYEGVFTRTKGRMVKPYPNETVFYALLIIFAITLIAVLILNKSKFGLSLKCIGQNEDSAQHIGVRTTRTKVLAFALSAAPMGATGVLMGIKIGYIDPNTAFNLNVSFFPVLMAIFGGMTGTYGPIIGSVIFFVLQDYLLRTTSWYMIIFGAVMVIVLLVLPKGVFGTVASVVSKKRKSSGGEVREDV